MTGATNWRSFEQIYRFPLLSTLFHLSHSSRASEPEYSFSAGQYSPCSRTCGLGHQTRVVKCTRKTGKSPPTQVSFRLCLQTGISKPAVARICNRHVECPAEVTYLLGACSQTCGRGFKIWIRQCNRFTSSGSYETLPVGQCDGIVAVPPSHQVCKANVPCPPSYDIGEWSACSVKCGHGRQSRRVRCLLRSGNGQKKIVSRRKCEVEFGIIESVRPCHKEACVENFVYKSMEWSQCSVRCLRERKVRCFSRKDDSSVDDEKCAHLSEPRPREVERCIVTAGRLVWTAGPWSKVIKKESLEDQER